MTARNAKAAGCLSESLDLSCLAPQLICGIGSWRVIPRPTSRPRVLSPNPNLKMSYSLNSLKGAYIGDYIGDYYRGY